MCSSDSGCTRPLATSIPMTSLTVWASRAKRAAAPLSRTESAIEKYRKDSCDVRKSKMPKRLSLCESLLWDYVSSEVNNAPLAVTWGVPQRGA